MGDIEIKTIRIEKPEEINFILGQTHFIKSVEKKNGGAFDG